MPFWTKAEIAEKYSQLLAKNKQLVQIRNESDGKVMEGTLVEQLMEDIEKLCEEDYVVFFVMVTSGSRCYAR